MQAVVIGHQINSIKFKLGNRRTFRKMEIQYENRIAHTLHKRFRREKKCVDHGEITPCIHIFAFESKNAFFVLETNKHVIKLKKKTDTHIAKCHVEVLNKIVTFYDTTT